MVYLKIAGVMVGAVVVTALGIDAADTLRGSSGTMLAQLVNTSEAACPKGMTHVPTTNTFSCVDTYEASPSSHCLVAEPTNLLETRRNLEVSACTADSTEAAVPWRYISREEAQIACARAGKRLPSAEEWYSFARDTKAAVCNTQGGEATASSKFPDCRSVYGVMQTVGNVWEWVADDVIEGVWQGRTLPATGYVAQVDTAGLATETSPDPEPDSYYQKMYFWSQPNGAFGMLRGGFYGSRSDAGVATVHAHTLPTFSGGAVGFRCVR